MASNSSWPAVSHNMRRISSPSILQYSTAIIVEKEHFLASMTYINSDIFTRMEQL